MPALKDPSQEGLDLLMAAVHTKKQYSQKNVVRNKNGYIEVPAHGK